MANPSNFTITPELKARFWSRVLKCGPDECWVWTGATKAKGYGHIRAGGASRMATHVALAIIGIERPSGALALHSCDNPPCCNPSHLRWGSAAENASERDARGRHWSPSGDASSSRRHAESRPRGVASAASKLTDEHVAEIRASAESQSQAAKRFGVSQTLIGLIRRRQIWKHLA